ncbi:MAG TPA: LysM peptidoglycan-binding domain-containing protein [Anaerolineales bacterium]|nr:LysM peptidoglycan-binding domain-containing protein [Anaerolineales bacterium]
MQSFRQLGAGIVIGIVSAALVIGGVFLSLAETFSPFSTPTPIPPTLQLTFPTITPSLAITQSETPTVTQTQTQIASETASITLTPLATCAPAPANWIRIVLNIGDTIYSIAERYRTTTDSLSAANCLTSLDLPVGYVLLVPPVQATVTPVPCGPFTGWVRTYIVRPGDNLFRIGLSYGVTVTQLQRANCMGSSITIFVGQRLWVPNIPTRTPGITIVPPSPTASNTSQPVPTTEVPSTEPPPTSTPIPTTEIPPSATQTVSPTTPVSPSG